MTEKKPNIFLLGTPEDGRYLLYCIMGNCDVTQINVAHSNSTELLNVYDVKSV